MKQLVSTLALAGLALAAAGCSVAMAAHQPSRKDVALLTHGVPLPLMAFALLFASSYFSVITPQGGSQNIIFAASGYLTQGELYKLGALITLAFLAVYLLIGSPWVYFVMR